ncbi:MAG: hypothetical protein VYC34_06100 [Planctomycetota bacterium]|nr:hypothetical protein [Planctomycetota bacterium]
MILRDLFGRLGRAQQGFRFKVVASIIVGVLAIGLFSAWLIYVNAPQNAEAVAAAESAASQQGETGAFAPTVSAAEIRNMLGTRGAVLPVALATLAITGLLMAVIWLGVALTYGGILAVVSVIALPLYLFESTRGLGQLLLGAAALTASFSILMQALRLAFSGATPVSAIARNLLNEAVRMKISIVFIVLLIFLLAALPGVLTEDQPLRYRVQQFLQYSVSGTFWVLALMTLFFSAGSVAFEQRDRIIWQTMSKPVRPFDYIFGKWLGVMGLNAVLLAVCASGVFLFTEHLRNQPAQGEERPFVAADGAAAPTTDRLLLESQVLVARVGAPAEPPDINPAELNAAIEREIQDELGRDIALATDPSRMRALRAKKAEDIRKRMEQAARSIGPGYSKTFTFEGLSYTRGTSQPLTLSYKINAGGDDPGALLRVLFRVEGNPFPHDIRREVALNQMQTLTFPPVVYNEFGEPSNLVDEQGRVRIEVYNGDPYIGLPNPWTMRFPPDGLEILYSGGSYEFNFLRVVFVLWIKLGFIAAIAIAASSFLSFPVACLMGLVTLFAAETAGFLMHSLNEYPFFNPVTGEWDPLGTFFRAPSLPVAYAFQSFSELNPTERLVDGRLIAWGEVIKGAAIIGLWILGVLGIGWLIFRKRELAIYSGH